MRKASSELWACQSLLLVKVVVTFYLRLRNEFLPFLAKNQASDWLNQQAFFLAGNGCNSFLNLYVEIISQLEERNIVT